jgi:hypothetical protein
MVLNEPLDKAWTMSPTLAACKSVTDSPRDRSWVMRLNHSVIRLLKQTYDIEIYNCRPVLKGAESAIQMQYCCCAQQ